MSDILTQLEAVLHERKQADPGQSYVARLYHKGTDTILKKLGEEAAELIIAAKNGDTQPIIHETADLWFHSLVLLAAMGLSSQDVLLELERRFGLSGLTEKAQRNPSNPSMNE